MTDKEKQITEMTTIMAENWFNETILDTAERLYNAGYRKIPKDSVVLTKEEVDRITKELAGQFGIVLFDEKGDVQE